MVRWEPGGQGRLAQAAMELYGERGFDQTTVAEIAERAGLTERTFFATSRTSASPLFRGAGAPGSPRQHRRRRPASAAPSTR